MRIEIKESGAGRSEKAQVLSTEETALGMGDPKELVPQESHGSGEGQGDRTLLTRKERRVAGGWLDTYNSL